MPQLSELGTCLKALHLSVAADCYTETAEESRREKLSYEDFLLALTRRELEHRQQTRTERWMHESRLPTEKTLAGFDRSRLPAKVWPQRSCIQFR